MHPVLRLGLSVGLSLYAVSSRLTELRRPKKSGTKKTLQEVHEIVKKIQARYEKTKDLQADFTQKTKIEGFTTPVVSSGRVYIKKPGRLRWDYVEPSAQEIYVNKDDVRMYVPEHKQVLVGKLTQISCADGST